ncbi:hypothetical protein EAG_09767 [Camponotus floridanus]|uniref:Uncharacterized protein n=1 Tax=Camponotus floridanus TaxID=104421 RepID=E1ZV87_CAMFO|nr:hypothetical protein EAG_09767 [Camponotus floridanus]
MDRPSAFRTSTQSCQISAASNMQHGVEGRSLRLGRLLFSSTFAAGSVCVAVVAVVVCQSESDCVPCSAVVGGWIPAWVLRCTRLVAAVCVALMDLPGGEGGRGERAPGTAQGPVGEVYRRIRTSQTSSR